MTYYSALHYAAKAEKSANLAEQYATQATSFSGKVVQIGFDGFMEDGQLVFKHSPSGVDIPYDLLDDYEYEIDMVYQGSDLADDVELVVKNGADTINFVSALHRDSTTPVTVKDMRSVMRYDESTGYRWLFKAAFKVTPLGNKVLLLYPVISVGGSGTGRNIGDIFYTSRLDTELNGAVDADGAIYSVEAFTGEKSVPELLRKGSLPSVSMAEYESIVSANGSCRAWGWDNGDTFRVPTLKDVYLMAGQAESAGEFISESLPNITGTIGSTIDNLSTGAFAYLSGGGAVYRTGAGSFNHSFNASRSSSTYQDGAKVRPDSVRYRAMVQIASGVQEDTTQLKEYKFNNPHFFGESKWSDVNPNNASWLVSNGSYHSGRTYGDYYQWLTDIKSGNKTVEGVSVKSVDDEYTDYDWVVNTADETFRLPLLNGEEDLPGDNRIDIGTVTPGGTVTVTAPKNGVVFTAVPTTSSGYISVINVTQSGTLAIEGQTGSAHAAAGGICSSVRAKRGDKINVYATSATSAAQIRFTPAVGNGTLYYYVGDVLQDPALINAGAVLSDLATKTNSVQAAAASMPSGRYIDLTLGANDSKYTAPASGEVFLRMNGGGVDTGYVALYHVDENDLLTAAIQTYGAGDNGVSLRVRKGQRFGIGYASTATLKQFRFFYAEGDENV